MSFLYAKDEDRVEKINLNDLYEKEHKRNLRLLSCFNKILNRIHKRIQIIAKNRNSERHVFFNVPEMVISEPNYDKSHCIAFLKFELESNDFHFNYIPPNTVYVSWHHWIPDYMRDQVKKRTGILIDNLGNVVKTAAEEKAEAAAARAAEEEAATATAAKYRPTANYRPTGKFVYNSELFNKIEEKVSLE